MGAVIQNPGMQIKFDIHYRIEKECRRWREQPGFCPRSFQWVTVFPCIFNCQQQYADSQVTPGFLYRPGRILIVVLFRSDFWRHRMMFIRVVLRSSRERAFDFMLYVVVSGKTAAFPDRGRKIPHKVKDALPQMCKHVADHRHIFIIRCRLARITACSPELAFPTFQRGDEARALREQTVDFRFDLENLSFGILSLILGDSS